ncbi:MAG: CPBP family intramembrane metalloprotease [Oscillospiraceae bacterium]|nr:CPBP family intramembrane metalloprotease [Oscillospiraceae bacterium]
MNETKPETNPASPQEGFQQLMTPTERILGWIWLPVNTFLLPILAAVYVYANPGQLSDGALNLITYAVSALAVLLMLHRFWRESFHRMLERPGRCLGAMLLGVLVNYALSLVVSPVLMMALDGAVDNPNNAALVEIAQQDLGMIKAASIFLAPLVEESLFRGVVFGSLRPKHRFWAYAVSAGLFALLHVWQYILVSADASLLVYVLQYIPSAVALAVCYERSGSIWPPIFLHMLLNSLAFAVLV